MNPSIIEDVYARKILDSRGNPTIEVDVVTRQGFGRCAAPSGASTGKYEVVAFPENSVDKALIEVTENIAPELIGVDAEEQEVIDSILKEIDGTENFSNIGGNTAVAVSLACAKAAASSYGISLYQYIGGVFACELPLPLGNVIGGGAHAVNSTDIQEFLVIPDGAKNILEAISINAEIHKKIKKELSKISNYALGKGDEGAWSVSIDDKTALEILKKVAEEVSDEYKVKVRLGIDVAASELFDEKRNLYIYKDKRLSREEQINYILELIDEYNLYYVEDPLHQEDFEGFSEITKNVKNTLICGDDLYVTNHKRIKKGLEYKSTNAVLIKPNQCGTLTDTFKAVRLAKNGKQAIIVSHRSGETTDETIAHLAVAFNAHLIKSGVVGGERIAKLNELVRIEEELGDRAKIVKIGD